MRCIACGYAGPTPEPARSHLAAARAALQSVDARERQISDAQRLAYDAHYGRVVGSFWVLMIFLGGLEVLAFVMTVVNHGTEDVPGLVAPVGGLSACALTGASILFLVRRDRRRFEATFAANPPSVEGGDATCHVCGAPLTGASSRGVTRCGFCQADNIVAPDVVRRFAKARHVTLADHAEEAARRARSFGTMATAVGMTLFYILLPVTLATHFGLKKRVIPVIDELITEEAPPFPIRYVLAGQYDCIHEIDGRGRIRARETKNQWVERPGAAQATTFDARRIKGWGVVVTGGSHVIGPEVIRSYGRPASKDNWVFAKNRSGDYLRAPVTSLCVSVPPHDLKKVP